MRALKDSEKKQRGTFRESRSTDRKNGANYTVLEDIPSFPKHLPRETVEIWYTICDQLLISGRLTKVSLPAIERYCQQSKIYADSIREIEKNGVVLEFSNGNRGQNPAFKVMQGAERIMRQFEQNFGFNPKAATSVKPESDPAEDENDPMLEILG